MAKTASLMEAQSMGCPEPVLFDVRAVGDISNTSISYGRSWLPFAHELGYQLGNTSLQNITYQPLDIVSAGRHFLLYFPDHQLRD